MGKLWCTLGGLALSVLAYGQAAAQATNAQWLRKPRTEDIIAMMPSEAARLGLQGRVVIDCLVTLEGRATDCNVVKEDPARLGFGEAAKLLAPTFLFKPATLGGLPVTSRVTVPIRFENAPQADPSEPQGPSYRAVTSLPWASAPTSDEIAKAFPAKAKGKSGSGLVVLRCHIADDYRLKGCGAVSEFPQHQGYAEAARALTPRFQANVFAADSVPPSKVMIDLPFFFMDPAGAQWRDRKIVKPTWLKTANLDAVELFYPAAATAKGVAFGRGVAECDVAVGGALTNCHAFSEEPAALGFGDAAAKVASLFVINPWTADGLPVDGRKIFMPIRLEAPPARAAAAPTPATRP